MARRVRTASAVNPSKRACPVCASSRVQGTFKGRETIRNRRIDASSCVCLECGSLWHEDYMVRAQEIRVSDVRKGQAAAPAQMLRNVNTASTPVTPTDPGRLCPVCGSGDTSAGFNGSSTGSEGRIDKATAGCMTCGALWSEAFYRRAGKTMISDVQPGALQRAIAADKANAARASQLSAQAEFSEGFRSVPSHARANASHSHDEGDGCPLCGSVHIGIKPHGNAAADCDCIDCGATWNQRYVAAEGRAYKSNIKPAP